MMTSVPGISGVRAEARGCAGRRGRYLIQVGGCNDCHTPAYPEKGGKVPEAQWLTGDASAGTGRGHDLRDHLRLYSTDRGRASPLPGVGGKRGDESGSPIPVQR